MNSRQLTQAIALVVAAVSIAGTLNISSKGNIAYATVSFSHSSNVAYVTDASSNFFQFLNGSNVWDHAVNIDSNSTTNCNPSHTNPCTYMTSGGNSVVFTDVDVAKIDAMGASALTGFDTVFLYQVCDIGSHAGLESALANFANSGHKVVIYDGDWCAPGDGGQPDYSKFLFPFTSSNPGPQGSAHALSFVESESAPAVLTRGIHVGDGTDTDAVGDSNTFVTFNPAWCTALAGPNANDVTGAQVAYARTSSGGLVIYNGEDNAVSYGPNKLDNRAFNNAMDQPWNPDNLPCNVVSTGITLNPRNATNTAGPDSQHTVVATVMASNGTLISGMKVYFNVTSGPNAGTKGTGVTDVHGNATFTYNDTGGIGSDSIQAQFTDNGGVHHSNVVIKNWTMFVLPESPIGLIGLMAASIGALAGLMAMKKVRKRASPDDDTDTGQDT